MKLGMNSILFRKRPTSDKKKTPMTKPRRGG